MSGIAKGKFTVICLLSSVDKNAGTSKRTQNGLLLFSSSVTSKPDPVGILFYMPLFAEKGDDIMAIATMEYIMNGQTYQLQKDLSTGKYKKVLTAPAKSSYSQPNHVYATTLKVKDQAGNVTTIDQGNAEFGSKMKLDVNEKVPPVITPTKPGDEAYLTRNSVQIQFDVTDNDSGVAQGSISLQIDNQAAITTGLTKTEIAGGYRCAYTANIADGDHTIKINAKDNDGNVASQETITFVVDTTNPELKLSSPATDLITNKKSLTVAGVTSDATSGPCTVTIKLNDVDQGAVTVSGSGDFSKVVSLAKGTNNLTVRSTDKAGKYTEVERAVVYDPDAPQVLSVEITPNPVDAGGEFTITVEAVDE